MKPRRQLASALTPDGGEMVLMSHDRDFSITVDGVELMNSRMHESERELARLGCAHLADREAPRVLIGGLGLGYTLRQALDLLGPRAEVRLCELSAAVVEWNRVHVGDLNGHPLEDERVTVEIGDVVDLVTRSPDSFDAILLDVDNGPGALTDPGNSRLYDWQGVEACQATLRAGGTLAVWSVEPSKLFEETLQSCGFDVQRHRVNAHRGAKSPSRWVYIGRVP